MSASSCPTPTRARYARPSRARASASMASAWRFTAPKLCTDARRLLGGYGAGCEPLAVDPDAGDVADPVAPDTAERASGLEVLVIDCDEVVGPWSGDALHRPEEGVRRG